MSERPVARGALVAGLLLGAALAAVRTPLQLLPRASTPELAVAVELPAPSDPETVTREWVEPVEERIRDLGRVVGHEAEVTPDGARWRVVLEPGVDPAVKAARLEAELGRVRLALPVGGALRIEAGSDVGGELAAIAWVRGDPEGLESVAERIRGVPGVRSVDLYGVGPPRVRVVVPEEWALEAEAAARARLRTPTLGGTEGPLSGRLALRPEASPARIPVPAADGVVPLGALGPLEESRETPAVEIRWRGLPSRALLVRRDPETDPLRLHGRLDAALGAAAPEVEGSIYWSEAEDLARVLRTGFTGLLLASLGGILWAVWMGDPGRSAVAAGALTPWVLVAGSVQAAWVLGVSADTVTLPALLLGCAAGFPVAAAGWGERAAMLARTVAAAVGLAAVVALAGVRLAPWLMVPTRAFFAGVAGAALAALLLPPLPRARGAGSRLVLRWAFREPLAALLAVTTLVAIVASSAGERLLPREGELVARGGDVLVTLRLPRGATREETRRELAALEEQIAGRRETEDFWALVRPGVSWITVDVRPSERSRSAVRRLATRWSHELTARGSVSVVPGADEGSRWARADSLEERPETDDEATRYRFVLRSADPGRLERAWDGVAARLARVGVRSRWITAWEHPSVRGVLEPRPGADPAAVEELAAIVSSRARPPSPIPLPGDEDRALLVSFPERPRDGDDLPTLERVLARPARLSDGRTAIPAQLLRQRERLVRGRLERRNGRFTVPVEVRFPFASKERRFEMREALHRALRVEALPTGVDLERPALTPGFVQARNLELAALGLAVGGLFFAIAAAALGSATGGTAMSGVFAVALVLTAGWGVAALGRPDALLLVGGLGGAAIGLGGLSFLASPWWGRQSPRTGRERYRRVLATSRTLLPGFAHGLILLAPAWLVSARSSPWASTLQGGALALGATLAAGLVVLPALGEVGRRSGREARRAARLRRDPEAWRGPGRPLLEVRSLVKVYSGGVSAVGGVNFSLEPGIVGLLGPNGAGKTTLLRMLTGLIEPTRGSIAWRGHPVDRENLSAYRRHVGFLPQFFDAYPGFTAFEFLEHWALESGIVEPDERRGRVDGLLEDVGLAAHRDRRVRDFSGGMKQRIGVARALLDSPPILVVDEPTAGLDLESRQRFREILLAAAGERIVVLSTHIASDVEAVASRLLVLDRGRIRFDGTPESLRARARGRVFEALVPDPDLLAFSRRHRVTARVRELDGVRVRAVAGEGGVEGHLVEPGLEEAYLVTVASRQSPVASLD